MKYSLKELISQIDKPNISHYKKFTPLFIEEAEKGLNWTEWDEVVFDDYFEKNKNGVAYLGQGAMRPKHKEAIKKNWMRLAPHLQAIAKSQNVPLWDEYNQVRQIIKECTKDNMQIATNRMLACLQPKLLCTEVDLKKVNRLIGYIQTYTYTKFPYYDNEKWENASHILLKLLHQLFPDRDALDFSYIPWKLLELFQEKEKTEMITYWLISSNDSIFRLEDYLNENQYVDWQASFSPKIGDIVFVYRTKPIQRICYMMEVVSINIPYRDTINDIKYWGENHKPKGETNPEEPYHRLKVLGKANSMLLHLDELKKLGLNGVPQGPRKIFGNLLEHILSVFNAGPTDNDFEELPSFEGLFEGAKKTIAVNQYERNRDARQKCIDAHGYKCKVCGMDFEKMYGELGRGFIHIHHVVPISTIGKEYLLDPVKDLVPVCPNCHAMLHRGINGRVLTVEELRNVVGKQK